MSLKSDTCTEGVDVYAAGISAEVSAHYPGRPAGWPQCYRHREVVGWTGRSQQRAYEVLRPDQRPEHEAPDRRLEFR